MTGSIISGLISGVILLASAHIAEHTTITVDDCAITTTVYHPTLTMTLPHC